MTLNIMVATPRYVICATDCRLVNVDNGRITTEQSTKLTVLWCVDAVALIAYNGIGLFQRKTPADWILELENKAKLTSLPLKEVLQLLRTEAEVLIRNVPKRFDRRHTFVVGAWMHGQTSIFVVSNYEEAQSEKTEKEAKDQFSISELSQMPDAETRVLATGSTNDLDEKDGILISRVAKRSGAAGVDIKNLCVTAIRNAAYRRRNRGPVGTNVLWAIAERYEDIEGGLDVAGGTTIHAMPNLIRPGMQMKDIRIEIPHGEPLSWGKPFPLPETYCVNCRNPVPLGFKQCSVCGSKVA